MIRRKLISSNPNRYHYFHFRCYHDDLANKSIAEIRQIYANYSNPSCTPYKSHESPASFNYLSTYYKNESQYCDRWIYELDHGYKSMSSEVSARFT